MTAKHFGEDEMRNPPGAKPDVACRCCGETLRADFQPGLLPHHESYWLLTCDMKECDLFGFTLGNNEYPTMDLTPYLESGRSRREQGC